MRGISFGQDVKFALPLHGTAGKDFWIDYYVDHDTSTGVRDAHCGTKTYDGHRGTDFLIRSFKTMDSGVYVYAMADGIVYETRDGNFDREKKWVKGHAENMYNNRCDELATTAADGSNLLIDEGYEESDN